MSDMKVKGTQRHNFDCAKVQTLLESDALDLEDATRILGEANNVICGLRLQVLSMARSAANIQEQGKSLWMGGAK